MCGIIGYVGRQEAAPILLEGLERMEYRGYDSTGMAVCGDGVLRVCKKKGRVQVLREMSHIVPQVHRRHSGDPQEDAYDHGRHIGLNSA